MARTRVQELRFKLRKMRTQHELEKELFRFIKVRPYVVMNYQENQLFRASVGADGVSLGTYSRNYPRGTQNTSGLESVNDKTQGTPYNMQWSGDFRNRLYMKVMKLSLIISSRSSDLTDMLQNPAFETHKFFGLTDQSMGSLQNTWLRPKAKKWFKEQMLT